MDCTDRHCRFFHRLLSHKAWLYTEMITANALHYGDVPRLLDFSRAEAPVALQLGGSEPEVLAEAAALGERWGYAEINLNCGCPSERVQRGAFGACLMAEPQLVAECVAAMKGATRLPVTVKHRIGIDRIEDYGFMRRFVEAVVEAGAKTVIVHARNAWLKGLSPKENREIPPLRYDLVRRLKADFPALEVIINGGITSWEAIEEHLRTVDGVMLGREAYHNPYLLAEVDARVFGVASAPRSRAEVAEQMAQYAEAYLASGRPDAQLRHVTRHMLGLYAGQPGGRLWRRMLSDPAALARQHPDLIRHACAAVEGARTPVRAAA